MTPQELDPQLVEDCAARGLTQKEAATELGVKVGSFVNHLASGRPLHGAWRRGRERFNALRRADELTAGLAGDDPRALVLKAVYEGIKSRREIVDATGLDYHVINNHLYNLEAGGLIEKVETLRIVYFRRVGSNERPPTELGAAGHGQRTQSDESIAA
jgi:DNA-binding CsgD family transcriptional regulator